MAAMYSNVQALRPQEGVENQRLPSRDANCQEQSPWGSAK